jgi:hypothetical protein
LRRNVDGATIHIDVKINEIHKVNAMLIFKSDYGVGGMGAFYVTVCGKGPFFCAYNPENMLQCG